MAKFNRLSDSAIIVAEYLLQIKAIKLQPNKPFTWASGWQSPIYCDNRKALCYPKIRTFIRQQLVESIANCYGKPEAIVGVATGGIAHGVLVAQELGVPFAYIRPTTKGHGLKNQVEGTLESGQSVVVIEDLVSTGKSSLAAVDVLNEMNCDVKGMAAIFTYNFNIAKENFQNHDCKLVTLSDYETLIGLALKTGFINDSDFESLNQWRTNPTKWGK